MQGYVLTWAGDCSAWECDDLGHLNMQFYVKKFGQARAGLMVRLGLTDAYKPDATSTVRVRELHIKYQGEARPGNPLKVESAVIALEDESAQLCHIMYHEDGRIAATIVEQIEHYYLTGKRTFNWPKRVRLAAENYMGQIPEAATPRNIDLSIDPIGRGLPEFKAAGLCAVGAGVFEASEIDITKRVRPHAIFARTTASISWFKAGWPELYDPDYRGNNLSAALLEARLVYHRYPEQGDAYHYYPVIIGADKYIRRFVHNLVDPVSGDSWVTMEACGCKFDLNERRLIKMTDEDLEKLAPNLTPDLTP